MDACLASASIRRVGRLRMSRNLGGVELSRKHERSLNRMFLNIEWLCWAPLAASSIHIFEEFAWPGGFPRWYRSYRKDAKSANRRFLIFINAGLLITLIEAAMAARTLIGVALLLTFSAVLFSNGCWHLWASYKSRSYSPGAISGTFLYLPLLWFEYTGWVRLGRASLGAAAVAFSIGISYPLWSALYHGRPQRA